MNAWQSLVLDLAVIASLTILAALGIAPIHPVLTMLGVILGARTMLRGGPPSPPAAGGGSAVAGLLAIISGHHP